METEDIFSLIGAFALPIAVFALMLIFLLPEYQFNDSQFLVNDTNISINSSWIISELNNTGDQTLELNSTQFETGEPATIKTSWLTSFIESISKWANYWTKTENINQTGYNISADYYFGNASYMTGIPTPDLSGLIPKAYGVSTSSASTTSKVVTIENYTPVAGDIIAIKFTYGSTTTQKWNLLMNGVWYYDIWVGGSTVTADYLLFSPNAVVLLYYDGAKMSVINPTYTNSYKWISLEENIERPVETIYGYKLAWKDGNNRFRPIIKTSGTTGNNKMPNTAGFMLGGKMVINPTGTTYGTSSDMGKDIKYIGIVGTTYNFNSPFTAWLPVYLKGKVSETDGLFYLNQANGYTGWYTQTLPTSEDGFVYVYVGNARSTYAIGLSLEHPAYEFKDGMIRLYGEAKNTHQDNFKEYFGTGNNFSIFSDGTNLVFNTSESGSGLAYFSNNVSATGYITRTSIFDKSKGTALNYIKDASEYLTSKRTIDHKAFYGYVEQKVTDFSRPVTDYLPREECYTDKDEKEKCSIVFDTRTTYPYTKIEDGVDLGKEIDVLRQAVYELKMELEKVKSETCTIKLFSWCIK